MASQPTWDPGRFLNTLTFFDVLPFSDTVRQVGRWLQGRSAEEDKVTTAQHSPIWIGPQWIVLAGLPPSIRDPLISDLQAQGRRVRVVDPVAQGLVSNSDTLQQAGTEASIPHLLSEAQVLVLGPELGRDRAQHLMDTWRQLPARVIFDFSHASGELRQLWGAVDDVVMGGVSQSSLQVIEGMALFAGTVSTANNGGFASIRTRSLEPPLDLSGYDGLELRVRGDGKRYKLFLRTETAWDSLAYGSSFDTVASHWITVRLPFAEMIPVFRAQRVEDAAPLDPSQIRAVQVMVSKFEFGKQLNPNFSAGPFALQLSTLGTYSSSPDLHPRLLLIDSSDSTPSLETLAPELSPDQISYRSWQLQSPGSPEGQTAPAIVSACLHILLS